MSFKEVQTLDADVTVALGGVNKKTGKANPTQVEGYFLGTRVVESKMARDGTSKIHFLKTGTGNIGLWGKTDLDRKLGQVTKGTMIRITQDGKMNIPGKNAMYKFKVEVDASDTIEVELPQASLESNNSEFDSPAAQFGDEDLTGVFEDELSDDVEPSRPLPPARAAATPDARSQQKVKELLAKARTKSA